MTAETPARKGSLLGVYFGVNRSQYEDRRYVADDPSGARGAEHCYTFDHAWTMELPNDAADIKPSNDAAANDGADDDAGAGGSGSDVGCGSGRSALVVVGDRQRCLMTAANEVKYWGRCDKVCGQRNPNCTCVQYATRQKKATAQALDILHKQVEMGPKRKVVVRYIPFLAYVSLPGAAAGDEVVLKWDVNGDFFETVAANIKQYQHVQQLEARSNTLEAQKSALEAQVAELRQQLAAALAGSKDKSKACSDVVGGRDGTDHNAVAASAAIASAGAGTSAGPSAAAPPDAAAGHGADVGTGCRSGVQQRCVVSAAVQTELQLLPPQAALHLQPDVPPAHTQPPLPPTIQQAEAQQAPWPSHQLALHSAASGESHQAGRTKPAPAPAAGSGSGAGPVRLGHGQQLQQHAMNAPAGTTAATTGPVGGAGAPPRLPPSQKKPNVEAIDLTDD